MGRKKKEAAAPEGAPAEPPGPSKMEAVRQALASGADSPDDGIAWIKEKFGLEVTKPQFSTYKSILKSKGGKTGGGAKRQKRAKKAAATAGGQQHFDGAVLDATLAIKELVRRHGADNVKRMVDVVS